MALLGASPLRRVGERWGLWALPTGARATFSPFLGARDGAGDAVPSLCAPQILVANDNACQLLGYSSRDLIGQKLTRFFLKPDSDVVEALSEEHVEADGHAAVVFGTVVSVGLTAGPVSVGAVPPPRRLGERLWHPGSRSSVAAGLVLLRGRSSTSVCKPAGRPTDS